MSLRYYFIVFILKIFSDASALVEHPQIEDNNILKTDTAIRETTNKLFSTLQLDESQERLALKQYSLVHNYLVSNSLRDYTNLKKISELTRVDKSKLNNQTQNFMTTLNEILNEEIEDEKADDEFVVRHIEGFITNLENFTHSYQYNDNDVNVIISETLKHLEKNKTDNNYRTKLNKNYDYWLESSHENDTVHDDIEFWHQSTRSARRIFMGKPTKIKEFPFMSSIQIFNHFQCAGSIIKSDLIITAASCLQLAWNNRFFRENPAFMSARVASRFHNGGGEMIRVLEVYFHPEYDPKTLNNNLAILRLWRRLKLSKRHKRVKKIDIDRAAHALPVNTDGITIVGWGARRRDNMITDPFLSFDVLDFYPLQECKEVYNKPFVTNKNFCAGFLSRGGGACNRDVGAPGIHHGILIGVASFGSPVCGTPDAPTVFTKVGFYSSWIDDIMEQETPYKYARSTTTRQIPQNTFQDVISKTTFKIKPIEITKKKRILTTTPIDKNVETLREINNRALLKKFVDTVITSEEAEALLRELNVTDKLREKSTSGSLTFTYSPATTLDPPPIYPLLSLSTIGLIDSDIRASVSEVTPDYSGNLETKEESYEYVEDKKNKKAAEKRDRKLILHETNTVNENKKIEVKKHKTIERENIKLITAENIPDYEKKEITNELKEDIVSIINEMHLNELVKDNVRDKTIINQKVNGKNGSLLESQYFSESERDVSFPDDFKNFSNESGLDIASEMFSDPFYNINASEDLISKQELLHIVYDALKEQLSKVSSTSPTASSTTTEITTEQPTNKLRPLNRKRSSEMSDNSYYYL